MRNLKIIRSFPDYNSPGFNQNDYRNIFKEHNVIVHAASSNIFYAEHWGTLTIKSAFGGDENFISGGCRYRVRDKSFLIINDGFLYSSYIDSPSPVDSLALFFNRKFTAEMFHYSNSTDTELLDNPLYYKNFNAEFDIYTNNSIVILNYLYKLKFLLKADTTKPDTFDYILRDILEMVIKFKISEIKFVTDIPALTLNAKKELYKRLERAKDYMHSNYNEDVSINTLAKVACLCPNHLIRRFKKFYGITPHQYLTKVRIDNSKIFLTESTLPVTEVCSMVGFQSLGSFSSLFASHTGAAPLNYRKKHSSKKFVLKK
ncbi:MAG: AraC family transcriptional regulator [Bacteroidota bacterium]|nr:AraC family transcriptional regulator [Bacteroidota bacterium]